MFNRRKLLVIVVSIFLLVTLLSVPALARLHPDRVVARIEFADRAVLAELAAHYDVWEVHQAEQYVIAQLRWDEYQTLLRQGHRVTIDNARTIEVNRPLRDTASVTSGIPFYACYRTVEETYASAQNLAAAHPDLAQWIDIGDSWEKVTSGGSAGYDLGVLKITQQNSRVPKAKLFVMSSVHAREYAPAELNTRFAEYLINNYGVNADVTWLLDYTEIHLLLQADPDGRKWAERQYYWRKNTDNNFCANSPDRGVDLNRNYPFQWVGSGSSSLACDETFRGPSAASEPETQAVMNYVDQLFPAQRAVDLTSPAPVTATGVFLDLHSYGDLVLWPWGFTSAPAPNATALTKLGRKFAYFNGYTAQQSTDLYPTNGTTDDFAYGELGVPAYTFEVGTAFFESCDYFQSTLVPDNLPALLYAAKSARRPYQTALGPDAVNLVLSSAAVTTGQMVTLTAVADGTRFAAGDSTQNIAAARFSIDAPSWMTGTQTYAMQPVDGSFDSISETLRATLPISDLPLGQHLIFVEAQDTAGNWGVPSAIFLSDVNFVYLPVIYR